MAKIKECSSSQRAKILKYRDPGRFHTQQQTFCSFALIASIRYIIINSICTMRMFLASNTPLPEEILYVDSTENHLHNIQKQNLY